MPKSIIPKRATNVRSVSATVRCTTGFVTRHWESCATSWGQVSASLLHVRLSIPHIPWPACQIILSQGDGCHISALTSNSWICEIWWVCFKSEALGPTRHWDAWVEENWNAKAINCKNLRQSGDALRLPQMVNTVSLHWIYHIPQSMVSFRSKLLQQFLAPQFGCQWDGEHFPSEEFSPTGT